MREYVVENEFVKAVRKAGGVAYKLTSQTTNGLPDRLQRKRRYQLMKLGFPVLCIDRMPQIKPFINAALSWTPGTAFPDGIGARIPDLEISTLPAEHSDLDDFGETLEPVDPEDLAGFYALDEDGGSD